MAFVTPTAASTTSFLGAGIRPSICPLQPSVLVATTSTAQSSCSVAVRMAFSSIDDPTSSVVATDSVVETADLVIYAARKQVFGNAYLMDTDLADLAVTESQYREGELSVRELVAAYAKSEAYRKRYFELAGPHKFIELNMKHLMGRAPRDMAEVSFHVRLLEEEGYDAEIDSYVNSEEYLELFGDNTVPRFVFKGCYPRNDDFNRMCLLRNHWDGCSTSTVSGSTPPVSKKKAQLIMPDSASCGNPVAIQGGIPTDHINKPLERVPSPYAAAPLNSNAGVRVRIKIADNLYRVFETDAMIPKDNPFWKKELLGTKKWNGVWF